MVLSAAVFFLSFNNSLEGWSYVCHVMRYTKFYRKIEEIIRSGVLGQQPVFLEDWGRADTGN